MLKNLDSDIELESMRQFSASLLVEDNTLDALNRTSEFAGRFSLAISHVDISYI